MEQPMELKTYIYPLRRWWWLLAAATLVAALSSFLVTLQQPPLYMAHVTLMIGQSAIEDPNPSTNQFWLAQQLATTYADIANREMVRTSTMTALGWDWLPAYRARAVPNSQLVEIQVTDTIPERAQRVANELANQLILRTPTSTQPGEQDRQIFVTQQLNTLEQQIQETQDQIVELQSDLGNMVSARQILDVQNQISALQGKLNTLTANYAALLSNTTSGAINTVSVIEPAARPNRPVGPAKTLAVAIAGMIGLVLASGAAYLLEYLDDTVKTPKDVEAILGYPAIGYIADLGEKNTDQPFAVRNPRHPISEAFRTLRTNLEFAGAAEPLKTILVSSPDTADGKTSIATNLTAVMAQGDKKVIIVDADMRSPYVHRYLGMNNEVGLSDVFRGKVTLQNALRLWRDGKIAVITAGAPPPNPAELLSSKKMDQILASLKEIADSVIIDGPPFVVSDAAILASKVDGVVLVIRPGFTRRTAAKAMIEQVKRSGARVVGVVLNRIPTNLTDYYTGQLYGYRYDDEYGGGDDTTSGGKKRVRANGSGMVSLNPAGAAKGHTRKEP
jgi:capsular exopolysaccharide synthesis family protein